MLPQQYFRYTNQKKKVRVSIPQERVGDLNDVSEDLIAPPQSQIIEGFQSDPLDVLNPLRLVDFLREFWLTR